MKSSEKHKQIADEKGSLAFAVVTVSDSRTPETDTNYHYLEEAIKKSGHHCAAYRIIKDEPDLVEEVLKELSCLDLNIILFNGGTGISKRDTTYDVISRMLEKPLIGFGELFRMLSYQQIGSAAMLSRATAGVYREKIVFSMPGSPDAVKLAWEKLIEPEAHHLVWEIFRL